MLKEDKQTGCTVVTVGRHSLIGLAIQNMGVNSHQHFPKAVTDRTSNIFKNILYPLTVLEWLCMFTIVNFFVFDCRETVKKRKENEHRTLEGSQIVSYGILLDTDRLVIRLS